MWTGNDFVDFYCFKNLIKNIVGPSGLSASLNAVASARRAVA